MVVKASMDACAGISVFAVSVSLATALSVQNEQKQRKAMVRVGFMRKIFGYLVKAFSRGGTIGRFLTSIEVSAAWAGEAHQEGFQLSRQLRLMCRQFAKNALPRLIVWRANRPGNAVTSIITVTP